jgi:hypothetical protein
MAGAAHTVAVRDFEAADGEAVADFDVAVAVAFSYSNVAAFLKALEGEEADTAVFVCEVWPDDVVEEVGFDGVDGEGEGSEAFWAGRVVESGSVDDESGHVVEMGMCDEVG